ncbi:MAG: YraN family protein [Patescibacteria group bacterium]
MTTRKTGDLGENIACSFLIREGFVVVDRNYLKKWGELDIVAKKDNMVHFFEVKSVTSKTFDQVGAHRPEDNVHSLKIRRIRRMIETYFMEKEVSREDSFQFHVLCVYMNISTRRARVQWLKNIIL